MKFLISRLFACVLCLAVLVSRAPADPTVVRLSGAGPTGWDNGLWAGDGQAAGGAYLNAPTGLTRSSDGRLVIADYWNDRLRAISTTGTISTIAGDGWPGNVSNATPMGTSLWGPWGVAAKGTSIVMTDTFNSAIRSVNADGSLTQIAGTYKATSGGIATFYFGVAAYNGDNQTAVTANLNWPLGICTDTPGNIYVADSWNQRIRKIDTFGTITTVAGNGWADAWGHGRFAGDNGLAKDACLFWPSAVVADPQGNLFIADTGNQRIRRVDAVSGIITTVAGTGKAGGSGDEASAVLATLNSPMGLALGGDGTLYIADTMNNRIRSVTTDGNIHAVGGTGVPGNTGDYGSALQATFHQPVGLTMTATGDLVVADTDNNAVRMILFQPTGTISGFVRDATTQTPLAGATVAWNGLVSTSDANGAYTIVAYGGQQPITAHLASYGTVTDNVAVVVGSLVTHDFLLPSGLATGTVYDDLGGVVAGATVTSAESSVTSAADGTFQMRLAPGPQTLVASKDGYLSSSPANLSIIAGQTSTASLVIYPLRSLPLAITPDYDWISSHTKPADYDTSLFDTAFPAEQLPNSNTVFSIPRGAGTLDFLFPDKTDGAKNVMVVNAQVINVPSGHYAGIHFLEAARNGPYTANLTLSYSDGSSDTPSTRWDDWAWSVRGDTLASNETVAISTDHRHSTTNPNSTPPVDILELSVPVNSAKTLVSFTLPARPSGATGGNPYLFAASLDAMQSAVGVLHGTVRDALTQTPIAGATVAGNGLATRTDANGAFNLVSLPGTVTFTASAPTYASAAAQVQILAGQTANHDFVLAGGSVAGFVIDDANHIVPGATVTSSLGPVATSAADGTYAMRVPTGAQMLTASKPGYASSGATGVTVVLGQASQVTLAMTRTSIAELPLAYGADWISSHTNPGDFATSGNDSAFPGEELPASLSQFVAPTPSGTETFLFPDKTDGAKNVVYVNGQTLTVPAGKYSALHFLEASQFGKYTGSVKLSYSDGTNTSTSLVFTDWANTSTAANENVAITCTHRHTAGNANSTPVVRIFQSQLAVNPAKTLTSIVLPADTNGLGNADAYLFAATLDVVGSLQKYGDTNGDGVVDAADAILALKGAAGLTVLDSGQATRGDLSPSLAAGAFGDGRIDIGDALAILMVVR